MAQASPTPGTKAPTLFIQTFGCQMNEYDSLMVERILGREGYRITLDIELADLIFLNTCSVRDKAEQKVHSFLGRLRRLKLKNPDLKIVVAGCVAQQLGPALLERFDYLDLVLGTRGVTAIGGLLEEVRETGRRIAHLPDEAVDYPEEFFRAADTRGTVTAPVTIMQGCDNFCTYCIVPYVRGRERSRSSAEILREIRCLTNGGVREVLLLGQNVNSYGRGLDENIGFVDLLGKIGRETDVLRVRFTTSHPKDLTEALIRCFAEFPFLCKHLHLPFQSGSDRILRRMNRGYTAVQYIEKIDRLRDACPEIALSSDVMVGFPGETEEEFRETLALMDRIRFDSLFSFRYSDRPFTGSSRFSEKVPEEVKARRLAELQGIQSRLTLEKNLAETGCVREVLVEGPSKASNGQMTGRTSQNRIVNFEGSSRLVGRIVRTEILSASTHSLRGKLLD